MIGKNTRAKLALMVTPFLAAAGGVPDAVEFICTPEKAVECDADLDCDDPVSNVVPPSFFRVDLDGSLITILGPAERRGETTPIDHMERDVDRVIIGGIQAGRGWSMSIPDGGGRYTLTVNLGDAGWVVFGQCIPADQLSP